MSGSYTVSPAVQDAAEDLGAMVYQYRNAMWNALENYARIQSTVGQSNRKTNEMIADLKPLFTAFDVAIKQEKA